MSIFTGDFNSLPWLQEKTLRALQAAVSLVDLANEPDTTAWYKRKLLNVAEAQIERLAPVVALLYQAGSSAADRDEWGAMLEGGSFALATWCKKWQIADPSEMAKGSLRHLRSVEEDAEKAQESVADVFDGGLEEAIDLKLQIYGHMCHRLVHGELTSEAQRLLLWMLGGLWISDPPDVVSISKRFLPTDIGITAQQASDAYKLLYDQGIIERVNLSREERADRLSLKLIVRGLNDSKHALEHQELQFGFPGARINGKVTIGQGKLVELPKTMAAVLGRWFKEDQELTDLRDTLQAQVGDDRIYVESAELKYRDGQPSVLVHFRYPIDGESKPLEEELVALSERWLTEHLILRPSE